MDALNSDASSVKILVVGTQVCAACTFLTRQPRPVAALQRPRPVAALQRPRPVVVTLTSRLARLTTCRCWENIPGAPALQRQAPDIGGMHGWMLS